MPGTPHDWSIVMNGDWNLAILTPGGIVTRMFALAPGTPVEVHVALDRPATIRVLHENVSVVPVSNRLTVAPTGDLNSEALQRAATVASRALESLPVTPVSACGVNIKYRFDALPDSLSDLIASSLDDLLSDNEREIVDRFARRTVRWQNGVLNIELEELDDSTGTINFNFHRDSRQTADHVAWLATAAQMFTDAEQLCAKFAGEG